MQHLNNLILDLALIMVIAGVVTLIFKKLKLPVVLGYIIAGFLVSLPFEWKPSTVEVSNINMWADLGIIFLMFALGLEFSFKKIADVGASAIVTATTVMSAMIVIGIIIGNLLGFTYMDSIFLGGMLSMSSTMIILKSYEEYDLKKEAFGKLVLGTLVIEDIGGIFMMIILSTISVSKNVSGVDLFTQIGILLLMLVICLVIGIYIIPTFLKKTISLMNNETLLIVSVAICLGMVVIFNKIGFSEALGAFISGSILAGTLSGERIEKIIKPLKDLFGTVFFVSVGMMVVPETLVEYMWPILILTVVTIVGQLIFSTIGMILSGQSLHTAIRGGFSMVQIGEFSFILATLGKSLGVISDFLYPIIVLVSVITIFTTPLFIKNSEKVYNFINQHLPKRATAFFRRYTSDKRGKADNDSDWKNFISKYFSRTLIASAALFLLYHGGKVFLLPLAVEWLGDFYGRILTTVIIVVCMIPIINIMWTVRNNAYKKLWLKNITNRLPLLALRFLKILIAIFFVVASCREYLQISAWILIIPAIIIVLFAIRWSFLNSQAIKVETRFVANLNEKILHKRKEEETVWLGDKLYVVEFGLAHVGMCTSVRHLLNERILDVLIIKIVRDNEHINMPGPDEIICEGDIVTAMSSKGHLEAYLIALEKADHIKTHDEKEITLREYVYGQVFNKIPPEDQIMCCAIDVEKNSPLFRKTIVNSNFRHKYKGFIIGIERDNFQIIDPPKETIIEEGDIVWAVGRQEMASKLLKDDLIKEV